MALKRFVEVFYPDYSTMKPTKTPLTEAQRKFVESKIAHIRETFEVPAGKSVYRLPISRFDCLNGNKRKYEGRLWSRVKEQQRDRYVGKFGLADHPPENADGSFKESAIVWLDIELDESNKIVWGYGVPIGPYGSLLEDALSVGGLPGFSSSGFGELDEDGSTVKYDSYELERPADIVLTPSQGVYGDKTMVFQTPDGTKVEITPPQDNSQPKEAPPVVVNVGNPGQEPIQTPEEPVEIASEPVQTTPEPIQASSESEFVSISDIISPVQVSSTKVPAPPVTNCNRGDCNKDDPDEDDFDKENPDKGYSESTKRSDAVNLSTFEQRKLEKEIVAFFEEAKKEKNPITKAGLLKEVHGFFNDIPVLTPILKNLKETVGAELQTVSNSVRTTIEESLKIEEEIGVTSVDEMKAGLDKLAEATFSFNENADHWRKVAEKLQKNVKALKAQLSANPTVAEYEEIVRELEKTDKATRKIVDSQNIKIQSLKKRLFDERNLSRVIEAECSEVKAELTSAVSAKKRYREKATQFRDAYLKVIAKNKSLISERKNILEDVENFLNGDMYRFGREQTIPGSPADRIAKAVDFTERPYVESYYNDLERQYGDDIKPFKEKILSRKTYKEAVATFTRIFAEIDNIRVPRGLEGEERKEFFKEHGIVIKDKTKATKSAIREILNGYRPLGG